MMKHTILCVDDEIDNVDALERLFRKKYTVLKAVSGKEALKILDQNPVPIALIITDQRMPEMTGVELLEKSIPSHPETVRILLTGYTDLESVIMAVNQGQIFRYLTKPWDPTDLVNTVDRAIERYVLGQELKQKNRELGQALDELKSLDTAKSNFMILINHELKTPLTSILSFSALLSESNLNDEDKLMVQRIQKSGDRLKNLIDDVLLIVRAETNQLKLDMQALVFTDFEKSLPPDVNKIFLQKMQIFLAQYYLDPVMADSRLIKQVMNRIIHNAVKFGLEGSEIEIRTAKQPDGRIRFSVHNKGPQIAQRAIDKIFKPFFIDEDAMNHSTGVGLGLTISQSILKFHDSSLKIQNERDGVLVYFDLKVA
jgi:two-component system sensor histidine kinase/response regulator